MLLVFQLLLAFQYMPSYLCDYNRELVSDISNLDNCASECEISNLEKYSGVVTSMNLAA